METKYNYLESMGIVYELSAESNLDNEMLEFIDDDLEIISKYLNVTKRQAFIISLVFVQNYKTNRVELNDLISHLECNPVRLLEFSNEIEELYEKKIFAKTRLRGMMRGMTNNDILTLNDEIKTAILKNEPIPVVEKEKIITIIDVLCKINEIIDDGVNDEITPFLYIAQANREFQKNKHFPLLNNINRLNLNHHDNFIYLRAIWKTINGSESFYLEELMKEIFDSPSENLNYIQSIISEQNKLFNNDLMEIVEGEFFNLMRIKLTDKSLKLLEENDIKLYNHKVKKDNVITPSQVKEKILVYNENEKKQLDLLRGLLVEDQFKEIQNRLISKNLPKGFTALLYGAPGTGKTETVYQIGKATGRDIIKVDMSESKSMWYGESQKVVKKIFNNYITYAKQCKLMPILLFNEADALISKRMDLAHASTQQTENAIQNIVLEELENFEGIFFATTNMASNLDEAFDRRFLFKIEFFNPEPNLKTQIWKLKFPELTIEDCSQLAQRFEFSGGQMENIVRKTEMNYIYYNQQPTLEKVMEFCKNENISKNKHIKIGF